jgi:hypothetical protein
MSASVAKVLEPFGDAELIPLPELRKRLPGTPRPVTRSDLTYAKQRGVLEVAPVRGPNGRDQVTRDEASNLIVAAIIAAAAGIALVIALQVVKSVPISAAAIGAASAL